MSSPNVLPQFTPEEYLALERNSGVRHEYLDGFVYAMAGESPEQSTICFNLGGHVGAQLKGKPCRGFSPNMKVRTEPRGLYAYPDLAIVCGELVYHDEHRDVLVNPTAIFEVLSPSTEAYDRGEKFLRYSTHIATLKDYILVSQDRPRLEHFFRQPDGLWASSIIDGLENSLYLSSIDCRIVLSEIYDRITFTA